MRPSEKIDEIITKLYQWCRTYRNQDVIKDTTGLSNTKFDAFVESSASRPLSFTIFELSDKGELLIDSRQRLLESQAAFYLFVNPKTGWIFAIKNTLDNQEKLMTGKAVRNYKIKIVE